MKKIVVYLLMGLLLAVIANAYTGIVSITPYSLVCDTCTYKLQLTGITGLATTGRTVCISTSSACTTCISGSDRIAGNNIIEGDTYYSNSATLTASTTYYACLKLKELSGSTTSAALSTCASSATAQYYFTLAGTTCTGWSTVYIGGTSTQEELIFAFPFVA